MRNLKSLSLAILMIIMMSSYAYIESNKISTPFCEGWEDGYKEGYCYRIENCLEPLVPQCPLPEIDENGYNDGYNRGFINGLNNQ